MNSNPLISIVIANYNYGHFIGDAIRSVVSQHLDEVELIVVDGASTDNSLQVAQMLAGAELFTQVQQDDKGSHVWHVCEKLTWISEEDHGQSDAFNKGFGFAHGRFLTWLNADDVFVPGGLSAIIREIHKHPDCEWFTGSSVWCDANLFLFKVFRAHRFSTMRLNSRTLTCGGPSSFFTKRIYEAAGKIDESLHFVMDNDLWYRFALKLGTHYRRTTAWVWAFRYHAESKMSGRIVDPNAERSRRNNERIQEEGRLMKERYGTPNLFWRMTRRVPVSIIDSIVAGMQQLKWKGRHLNFITGQRVSRPIVLLSNAIQEYIGGLQAMGAEVFAFNNLWRKKFTDTENVHYLGEEYFDSPEKCSELVDRVGVNVLYAQGARSMIFFAKVRKLSKVKPKLIGNCHTSNLWNNGLKSLVLMLASAFVSDGFVFITERTQHKWRWLCRLMHLTNWHIPNPVDLMRFNPKPVPTHLDKIVLGSLGSIRSPKNQEMIIEVVHRLRNEGVNAYGYVGGNVPKDGVTYKQQLDKMVRDYNLTSYITFGGQIDYDNVPFWMNKLDVYVCPSKNEVMPFNILEAMATGLPVIAHDVGGINEEVNSGENGFLIASLNPLDYVHAVQLMIKENTMATYGKNGRKKVESRFSFDRYSHDMAHVIF